MSYHKNHAIDSIMLQVINDGRGTDCGYSYDQRIALARKGYCLAEFRDMARNADSTLQRMECPKAARADIFEAASLIQKYYEQHVLEIDAA